MSSDGPVRGGMSRPPISMPTVAVAGARASGSPPAVTPRVAARPAPDGDADGDLVLAHVGPSMTIKGDLTGEEDALVEGRVEGRIEIPAHHLTIGTHGVVIGHVLARHVTVLGRVEGGITVLERIEVSSGGRVDGDIRTPTLVIREGAEFNGSVVMGQAARPAAAKRPEPTTRVGTSLMMMETPSPAPPKMDDADNHPVVANGEGSAADAP
jgi:cytoskeletal protein CcmA (bactofilin family)